MVRIVRSAFGAALAMSALLVWAIPAQAQTPEFITDCDPDAPLCTETTVTDGSTTIRNTTVDLPEGSVVLRQGLGFADGNGDVPVFPPPSGDQLQSEPVPAPGLQGLLGVTVRQELADDVTARILPGEFDEITLPLRLRVEGPLLGSLCRVGTSSNPVEVNLTNGTTNPPAPNQPISGNFPTGVEEVPYGDGQAYTLLTGGRYVDNAFAVPESHLCGLIPGTLNWLIDLTLGLPSPAGLNTIILDQDTAVISQE